MTSLGIKLFFWKKRFLPFIFCLFTFIFILAISPARAATAKHYTELTFPPLPEVTVPPHNRFQLPNGLTVYLMEDHEWPVVSGMALIRTGDRFEPADKVGLAGIMGDVLRSGGTQSHPAAQLNQLLEQRAAAIESGMGTTSAAVNFSALSEDLPDVFHWFAEVLQEPVFAQDKVELEKTQRTGAIARRNDDPETITSREFYKLIYGENSPYARIEEYQTLANISQTDLVNFYQQYFHPNRIILGIVGDFETAKMRSLVQQEFGNWPNGKVSPLPPLPAVAQANKSGVFLVNQPQLSQSYVQLGQLGIQLNNPDVFPLYVMNGVLNGFGGRLFNQVRSRQGLAYSVYALWSPEFDYPGVFVAGGQTRSQTTVPFIQSVKTELNKLRTAPVTAAELAYAKDSILNSFVFNFQDPAQTLSRLMRYEYFGYPSDFIFRYQRGVKTTTAAEVQRVANQYLKPEQIVTLVVGNTTAIEPPLTTLQASVTPVDITIPQPSQS